MAKLFLLLIISVLLSLVTGVFTPARAQAPAPPAGFTGVWKGTIRVMPSPALRDRNRTGAVNNITVTILDQDSQISGHYTCSIGTQICRNGNADNSGKVVGGKVNGNNIRFNVIIPADLSNCMFNGFTQSPGQMRGGYTCYQGGGLVEQGNFEVSRVGG